jgi:sec-independent protein translocase protein TatA
MAVTYHAALRGGGRRAGRRPGGWQTGRIGGMRPGMNLGVGELLVILVIVVVLFGSSRLPALGKGLGEAIRGFKDSMKDEPPAREKKELPPQGGAQK